jgi:hypothetical protein
MTYLGEKSDNILLLCAQNDGKMINYFCNKSMIIYCSEKWIMRCEAKNQCQKTVKKDWIFIHFRWIHLNTLIYKTSVPNKCFDKCFRWKGFCSVLGGWCFHPKHFSKHSSKHRKTLAPNEALKERPICSHASWPKQLFLCAWELSHHVI